MESNRFNGGGREWVVEINVAQVKAVRTALGVDLLKIVDEKELGRLSEDPVELCNILYVLCRDQAKAAGLDDEGFGRMLAGDTIAAATDAFLAALVSFFPSPRLRQSLGQALQMAKRVKDKAEDLAAKRLDQTLDQIERKVLSDVEGRLRSEEEPGGLSGTTPATSESTPALSHSGN